MKVLIKKLALKFKSPWAIQNDLKLLKPFNFLWAYCVEMNQAASLVAKYSLKTQKTTVSKLKHLLEQIPVLAVKCDTKKNNWQHTLKDIIYASSTEFSRCHPTAYLKFLWCLVLYFREIRQGARTKGFQKIYRPLRYGNYYPNSSCLGPIHLAWGWGPLDIHYQPGTHHTLSICFNKENFPFPSHC